MGKPNFPDVDVTAIRSTYRLIDVSALKYSKPGEVDILQSREDYGSDSEIEAMELSILSRGVLEPIIVMENDEGEGYRVLEGNRRAFVVNGLLIKGHTATDTGMALSKVRCEVRPSVLSITERTYNDWLSLNQSTNDEEKTECRTYIEEQVRLGLGRDALIRNTQRKNWSPVEAARQIQLQLEAGRDMEEVCKDFGMAESTLKDHIRLLEKVEEMPEVLEALESGEIGSAKAKLFTNVENALARKELLDTAIAEKASTSKVKDMINQKHEEVKASDGKGIKSQDRKKRAPRPPQGVKKLSRSTESLTLELQKVASLRASLVEDEGDEVSTETALDLEIALKTLQWVLNPSDNTPLSEVIIGLEDS